MEIDYKNKMLFDLHFCAAKVNQPGINIWKRPKEQASGDKNLPPSPPGQPIILLLNQELMIAGASYKYVKKEMLCNSFKNI